MVFLCHVINPRNLIGRDVKRRVTFGNCKQILSKSWRKEEPVAYDDIHEITRDLFVLIKWLQKKGVIGNFGGDCNRCGARINNFEEGFF